MSLNMIYECNINNTVINTLRHWYLCVCVRSATQGSEGIELCFIVRKLQDLMALLWCKR